MRAPDTSQNIAFVRGNRKAIRITALSSEEMVLISESTVQTDEPYSLDDIPDIEDEPVVGRPVAPTSEG